MQHQTALLLLSATAHCRKGNITEILTKAVQHVKENLYIHLYLGRLHEEVSLVRRPPSGLLISSLTDCYAQASLVKPSLSLNVLLRYTTKISQKKRSSDREFLLHSTPDIILTDTRSDSAYSAGSILQQVNDMYNISKDVPIKSIGTLDIPELECNVTDQYYNHCALGGTFDQIHNGHKALLGTAVALSKESLTIGVTDENMNCKKVLCELIAPLSERLASVKELVTEMRPGLNYDIVPIQDAFGPTITKQDLDCLIISEETVKGGAMVNERRQQKEWHPLHIHIIPLVDSSISSDHQDKKISSSSLRESLLGQLINPPISNTVIPQRPYLIGLTGGIASGKSNVGEILEKLGASVISSDNLAHDTYKKGSTSYYKILEEFGDDILLSNGQIERRKLGAKVFGDKNKLEKLNSIVWPATAELVQQDVSKFHAAGKTVCFIEAALLLEAGWKNKLHEVWTCVVPENEAIKRIIQRNSMTEDEAVKRIHAQSSNAYRVAQSNVVLCTLWDYSVTQLQVEKAWHRLQKRL